MLLTRAQQRGMDGRDRLLDHILRTGCTIAGDPVWTDAELSLLRQHYPDRNELRAALPRRTPGAIAHKARKIGLVRRRHIWSEFEIARLRSPYVIGVPMARLTELFAGRSPKQIWSKASAMGYRRPRHRPKLTGMPLVDSVRQRAFDFRITMTDLDAFTGCKHYFVSPRYMNWAALQRAIKILGGEPVVRWSGA